MYNLQIRSVRTCTSAHPTSRTTVTRCRLEGSSKARQKDFGHDISSKGRQAFTMRCTCNLGYYLILLSLLSTGCAELPKSKHPRGHLHALCFLAPLWKQKTCKWRILTRSDCRTKEYMHVSQNAHQHGEVDHLTNDLVTPSAFRYSQNSVVNLICLLNSVNHEQAFHLHAST